MLPRPYWILNPADASIISEFESIAPIYITAPKEQFNSSKIQCLEVDMAVSGASHSPAPTETIETPAIQTEKQEGAVTDEQWHVMKQILDKVYRYRDAE